MAYKLNANALLCASHNTTLDYIILKSHTRRKAHTHTHLCVHKFRVNSAIYIKPSETFKSTNSQIKKKPTNAQRKSNRKRGKFFLLFFELRRKFTKATVASSRLSLIHASGRLQHTKKQVDKLQVQTLYPKIPSNFTCTVHRFIS